MNPRGLVVRSKPMIPTKAQRDVLVWLLKPGRLLYGPTQQFGGARWGFAGGGGPRMAMPTARALKANGWIEWTHDTYPLGYYRISKAGRAALAVCQGVTA